MILDYFIEGFRSRFLDRELVVRDSDFVAVIPAANIDIGKIEVLCDEYDEDELVVNVGEIIHRHYNCYDDELSREEKQRHVANSVVSFLENVFSDRIEFYGSKKAGGGWRLRDLMVNSEVVGKTFIWSGHQ